MFNQNLKKNISNVAQKQALKLWRTIFEPDPLSLPLLGDRCIEFAFIIRSLRSIDNTNNNRALDLGCFSSPLTTIIKEMGFEVFGIDLRPSPYVYEGVTYIQGDFLKSDIFKNDYFNIVILCSTIEHIGIQGRYGSEENNMGDIETIDRINNIIKENGILIITLPYGVEKTIFPVHRVYNKKSHLFKNISEKYDILIEDYYKNNSDNVWIKCTEKEAENVVPSEDNYALGLFCFRKR